VSLFAAIKWRIALILPAECPLNRQKREILWRFPMLVACTIDTGELQPDADSNE
jgi:hypothetical protein